MSIKGNWRRHGSEVVIGWCQRFFSRRFATLLRRFAAQFCRPQREKKPLAPRVPNGLFAFNLSQFLVTAYCFHTRRRRSTLSCFISLATVVLSIHSMWHTRENSSGKLWCTNLNLQPLKYHFLQYFCNLNFMKKNPSRNFNYLLGKRMTEWTNLTAKSTGAGLLTWLPLHAGGSQSIDHFLYFLMHTLQLDWPTCSEC